MEMMATAVVMTAGTSFCLWLGDEITKKGIGNGSSMIILAGILFSMPRVFVNAYNGLNIFMYILVLVGVIYTQLAERRIPIQYANRTNSAYGGEQSYLPIKLNSAGVIPVIFAQIILSIPSTIAALFKSDAAVAFMNKWIVPTSNTGMILYLILIFFFGYFYTFMMMNPDEMSKNLNERGGYIPGVRPGSDTSKYISNSIGKLTIVGSIFLMIIAILPTLVSRVSKLGTAISIGGTGILIVVGVAIETYKQLESSLLARSYKEKRRKLR